MADIPNLIKHWPCAVKTHFPGQHTRHGRSNIIIYIYTWRTNWIQLICLFPINLFSSRFQKIHYEAPKNTRDPEILTIPEPDNRECRRTTFFSGIYLPNRFKFRKIDGSDWNVGPNRQETTRFSKLSRVAENCARVAEIALELRNTIPTKATCGYIWHFSYR